MLVLWKSLYLTHLKKDGEEVKVPNFYLKKIEVFFFNINTKNFFKKYFFSINTKNFQNIEFYVILCIEVITC